MAKTLDEKREQRLKEINELTEKREVINARLSFLMGLSKEEKANASSSIPLPVGFSLMNEIEQLFQEKKEKDEKPEIRILEATALLQTKFPQYLIERTKVHSAMAYLAHKKKGVLKKEEERGLFSLIPKKKLKEIPEETENPDNIPF